MHRLLLAAMTAAFALLSTPCEVRAQGGDTEPALSLHDQARTKFQELHRRMQTLQSAKQSSEPEQSRLLQTGNRFIQERRIHEAMEQSRELIEAGDYDQALEAMSGVSKDLADLLALLLNRDLELERLMERIKELEEFRDRVDDLIDQQKAEKADAAETEALLEKLEQIKKAKEAVGELIKSQTELRAEANQSGMSASPEKAEAMADKEAELKERADDLAEQLEKIEKADEPGGSDGKPADSEGKPGEGSGSPSKGGKGSESSKSASQSMQQAQNKLQDNQPERSLDDMDKAIDSLKQTEKELEKLADEARRKLEQLSFDLQQRKQEQTRIDTDKLAQDMENAEQGDGEEPGEQTPGKQNVQQAVPKQKAAAGQLKERKPGKAKQDQQDAADDLEKAKQQLEDALAQLRQQLEDEVLRALEERFGEMLARQKEISARTKAIDGVRETSLTAGNVVPAQVRNTCTELGVAEGELAGEASDALKLLEEDGRSAAFPMIVEELRDDLTRVSDRLAVSKCSTTTQLAQADIEATLNDLLNALRKTIEDRAGGT